MNRSTVWIKWLAIAARVGVPLDVLLEMRVIDAERRVAL